MHRAVIAGRVDVSALRARIENLEQQWFAEEARIMSADIPDESELAALSAQASQDEQLLIDEFYDEDWQTPVAENRKNRNARYWKSKNVKLGLERA